MSRIAMNMPNTMARKAIAFFGSMRSSAGAIGPIVVSAAMTAHSGMEEKGGAKPVSPRRHLLFQVNPRIRSVGLFVGRRARIDIDHDTQARADLAGFQRFLRDHDANRNALYDLGE